MRWLVVLIAIAGCGATSAPRPAVSALTIDPPAAVLVVGEVLQLHALPVDASGNHLIDRPVTWQSADPLVATVAATGLVTSVAAGRVSISASCEGRSAEVTIDSKLGGMIGAAGGTVSAMAGAVVLRVPAGALVAETRLTIETLDVPPAGPGLLVDRTGFRLGPANLFFLKPASLTLRYDPMGIPTALSGSIATYSLDGISWDAVNGSVLDSAGRAVTAPLDGTGSFALRAPGPVASLTIVPSSVLVVLGTTAALRAEPRDEGGNLLQNRAVAWTSSDTLTATVSQTGVVSGVGIGIARITAASGGALGRSTVVVAILCSCPAPPASLRSSGPVTSAACACAAGSPMLVRRRVP